MLNFQSYWFPYIVFEDDAKLDPDIEKKFDAWVKEVPDDWYILYLGAHNHLPLIPVSEHVGQCTYSLSTVGYMINPKHMVEIREIVEKKGILDMLLVKEVQKQFPCYCFTPNLVSQRPGMSDIVGKRMDYTKYY
jgi:hypothetical protein